MSAPARCVRIGSTLLYQGDCRSFLWVLGAPAAVVTDPPYGIGYSRRSRSWQNDGLKTTRAWKMPANPPIAGDDKPFCPGHLVKLAPKVAIFGANHMAGLPPGGRWIVWDKRRDSTRDNHPDCELIWTNVAGADRIHRQTWRGIVREGEENCSRSRKLHPNQKPVALLAFIFDQLGVKLGTVVDPYMGSGSTGVVALRRGNRFIGIESDPAHFDVAVARLQQEYAAVSRAAGVNKK